MSATAARVRLDRPTEKVNRPKRQPRYRVILWDSDQHTDLYVIQMMRQLFGHAIETGKQIAETVDTQGRAICATTTLERAELKRDQILAYGKDARNEACPGSMMSTIEPVDEDTSPGE